MHLIRFFVSLDNVELLYILPTYGIQLLAVTMLIKESTDTPDECVFGECTRLIFRTVRQWFGEARTFRVLGHE